MKYIDRLTGFADEIARDLPTQIRVIKKLGMSHVEMRGVDGNNIIYHSDSRLRDIKKRLDDQGISLSAIASPLGKTDIREDLRLHFDEYKRAVETAHMLDTKNIRIFSFYIPEHEDHQLYEGEVLDRLGRMVDYAAANDVVLLHENEKGIFGDSAENCKKLMDSLFCDNFKAIFDFANFVQCNRKTTEAYELLKDYIYYVHIKDALYESGKVVPAGMGDGSISAILSDLSDRGFGGYLSLEPHLREFDGLEKLERGSLKSIDATSEHRVLTGEEAFVLAYNALADITG